MFLCCYDRVPHLIIIYLAAYLYHLIGLDRKFHFQELFLGISETMIPTAIKTVGVIGTGVIGTSWTSLFLAKGLRVIVSDPAPEAEAKLYEYLRKNSSTIPKQKITPEKYLSNLKFVKNIDPYLGEVDMIQEVSQSINSKQKIFTQT